MIIYITLAYGLIVTAGAVGVYLLMRRECRALDHDGYACWCRAVVAEQQLSAIKSKRHNAAVKARAAQIAQRKAQVLAKAAELQVDRIAA